MNWQPIETAPKDGTVIDIWTETGFRITDVWWDGGTWTCGLPDHCVTHWAPLLIPEDNEIKNETT